MLKTSLPRSHLLTPGIGNIRCPRDVSPPRKGPTLPIFNSTSNESSSILIMFDMFSTGRHYRNILIDRDCDKALPIFLLFSEQTKSLIGFGWAGPINVPSTEWEKPPPSVFSVSTQRWIFTFAIKVLFKSFLFKVVRNSFMARANWVLIIKSIHATRNKTSGYFGKNNRVL